MSTCASPTDALREAGQDDITNQTRTAEGGTGGIMTMLQADQVVAIATRSRRRGFTLVELLVVIPIVLLVSAVALTTILPAYNDYQMSAASTHPPGGADRRAATSP